MIWVVDGIHDGERQQALGILKNIGPEATAAVPILIQTLDDKEYLRDRAIETLIKSLNDKSTDCRRLCIVALGLVAIQPKTNAADTSELIIPAIAKMLTDNNFEVEREACFALGAIGPAAQSTMQATDLICLAR